MFGRRQVFSVRSDRCIQKDRFGRLLDILSPGVQFPKAGIAEGLKAGNSFFPRQPRGIVGKGELCACRTYGNISLAPQVFNQGAKKFTGFGEAVFLHKFDASLNLLLKFKRGNKKGIFLFCRYRPLSMVPRVARSHAPPGFSAEAASTVSSMI